MLQRLPSSQLPQTTTRKQRLQSLFTLPIPQCASSEYKHEYYKLTWMLRELINTPPYTPRDLWLQNLLSEALITLNSLSDPTASPAVCSRADHAKWTDVMVRRIVSEALWEENSAVTFYDCCDALKVGRSRAAAVRLLEQAKTSWMNITQTDLSTEFSLTA